MNQPPLVVNAPHLRALLAGSLLALLAACSSSSTPKADLSACEGNTMVTLAAVPVPGGGGGARPTLTIHYQRPDGIYTGWVLHAFGAARDPGWTVGYPQAGTDAFGVYFQPEIIATSGDVGYIIHNGDTKDLPADQTYTLKPGANEIWRISGDVTTYYSDPTGAGPKDIATVRVHYLRFDSSYSTWGLHLFTAGGVDASRLPGLTLNDWANPIPLSAMPGYTLAADGSQVTFDIPVINPKDVSSWTGLDFVIHGLPTAPGGGVDNKDGRTSDLIATYAGLTPSAQVAEIWIAQEDGTVYSSPPDLRSASTTDSRAVWLTRQLLQWPKVNGAGVFKLHHSATGQILAPKGAAVTGSAGALTLDVFTGALAPEVATRFTYLSGGVILSVKAADLAGIASLLKDQVVVVQEDAAGLVQNATTLQVAGALDDLYATANAATADLGVSLAAGSTAFKLWAPTARAVSVCTYDSGAGAATGLDPMTYDAASGTWSVSRPGDLSGKYYRYVVEVFVRGVGLVRNLVTDPYSVSLTTDSTRSYVADLAATRLRPSGWDTASSPPQPGAQTDLSIYELHVRDFSINDATVPAAHRGKYLAFTDATSDGMKHLQALAVAGITDIHLLPVFDLATVRENPADRVDLDSQFSDLCARTPNPIAASRCATYAGKTVGEVLASFGPAAEQQQEFTVDMAELDGFNWGYDPFHFTAPEGSYASDAADGATRVLEFRQMVMGLHQAGLRVGMDVVYNHTTRAGQDEHSVLDRIVPGYYHRLDALGAVQTSTCCSNTATENAMMAKLMSDSVVTWATQYRIDSFRFDLMGHQPRSVMEAIKARVATATGRDIQLIGEGWNFGEVANGVRFVQASQLSLNGSGIATFTDRARDRIRGGSPFDGGPDLVKNQGYVNGLSYDPNPTGPTGPAAVNALGAAADMVRVGLAGSIRDYPLTTWDGTATTLQAVDYNGQPAGYVTSPDEVVNYIENHDNQTFYDINVYKLPVGTSMDDRVRVQLLGVALNAFSQGLAYYHAGVDTLRSKSMDRNSYNSGDWFNRLDWTYATNNYGVGAPPQGDNGSNWSIIEPLLNNSTLRPSPTAIAFARDGFRDLLAVRKSSTLFRLRTAADVKARLTFPNSGLGQVATVMAGHLDGAGYTGAGFAEVLYLVNVDKVAHDLVLAGETGKAWVLHPVQAAATAADPRPRTDALFTPGTGTFTVPPRTTVVYVIN
jgi:pullulanase-type alpha-1,6-glucosidase